MNNKQRPENDHDAIVEIWVMMNNHLQHHVKWLNWWVMIALVLLGSFAGPLLVGLLLK